MAVTRVEILEHLVMLARDTAWKQYAWRAAKQYEEINPYELGGLQEELKQEMLKQKGSNNEVGSNRNSE